MQTTDVFDEETMAKQPIITESARLSALLGVASTMSPDSEDCPSEDEWTKFIATGLSGDDREQMLAHINNCPHCYKNWLQRVTSDACSVPRGIIKPDHLLKFYHGLIDWFTTWKIAIPVACALLLTFYLLPLQPVDFSQRLETLETAILTEQHVDLQHVLKEIRLPWEGNVMGFARQRPSQAKLAYGAGLWEGRSKVLLEKTPLPSALQLPNQAQWQQSEWAAYYHLGRFTTLLWSLTAMSENELMWDQTSKLATTLTTHFSGLATSDKAANQATAMLQRLSPLLLQRAAGEDPHILAKIKKELQSQMQRLAPVHL